MIILKIVLGFLVIGLLEFFYLFLWSMFVDWSIKRKIKKKNKDESEI